MKISNLSLKPFYFTQREIAGESRAAQDMIYCAINLSETYAMVCYPWNGKKTSQPARGIVGLTHFLRMCENSTWVMGMRDSFFTLKSSPESKVSLHFRVIDVRTMEPMEVQTEIKALIQVLVKSSGIQIL